MEGLLMILKGTPLWVFGVFALGIYLGIVALFERTLSVKTLFILPTVFLVLSITSLIPVWQTNPLVTGVWLASTVMGGFIGWLFFAPKIREIAKKTGSIRIPGSFLTMVLFLLIFSTKYFYNVQLAINPNLAASPGFQSVVLLLTGLCTGLICGRVAHLYRQYFRHAEAV